MALPDAAGHDALTEQLVLALYREDTRLGIVRPVDLAALGAELGTAGLVIYRRRAKAILRSLARVPDAQVVQACQAEGVATPRGAAAQAELTRRGLTLPAV